MNLVRRYLTPAQAAAVQARFKDRSEAALSYATVRDYCESVEWFPKITATDGDLKNVQRPWAVKAVLGCVSPPASILEIGGGEPIVSGLLSDFGYDVTLIDPYDGFGNGPLDYAHYVQSFPNIRIVRDYLRRDSVEFPRESFDLIFSISVLEHISAESLESTFDAIAALLKPGGCSLHCFDFVLQGAGQEYAREIGRQILRLQSGISGEPPHDDHQLASFVDRLNFETETFFLSPQGHNLWRGAQTYDQFPFRKVVSVQTITWKPQVNQR